MLYTWVHGSEMECFTPGLLRMDFERHNVTYLAAETS